MNRIITTGLLLGVLTACNPTAETPNLQIPIGDGIGYVWEWCEDVYQKEYYQNGKRVNSDWPFKGVQLYFRRVIRGGSWGGTARGCRVSYIDYDTDSYRDEYGGFRVAMDKPAE